MCRGRRRRRSEREEALCWFWFEGLGLARLRVGVVWIVFAAEKEALKGGFHAMLCSRDPNNASRMGQALFAYRAWQSGVRGGLLCRSFIWLNVPATGVWPAVEFVYSVDKPLWQAVVAICLVTPILGV